ncbi:MAG: ABC transporter ATP-binding protein [SAR324 cluster bacterium]|nr:ABC transporter ATP-binding protein [SAR324 cluster bacterium]
MTTENILIEVTNLHKSYRDGEGHILHILKGLSLSVNQGATVSIVGASGTGKSTFLHLLGGLDTADEGEIKIAGEDLSKMTREETAKFRNKEIAYVFQFHHLLHDFTALENVAMPLRICNQPTDEANQKAKSLLSNVGLEERFHHKPSQLSGGEQQRVAIARAVANSPKILLTDEPTGNLDQETGQQILELLLRLNVDYGITLIVITHNTALADSMQFHYKLMDGLLHLQTNESIQ